MFEELCTLLRLILTRGLGIEEQEALGDSLEDDLLQAFHFNLSLSLSW